MLTRSGTAFLRRTAAILAVLACVIIAPRAWPAPPAHTLKISVNAESIDVAKATGGGSVLLIGFERTSRGTASVFRRVRREGTAGPDGTTRIDIGRPLVPSSFWVAIDLASGGFAAVTADGRKLREAELPKDKIKKDSSGRPKRVVTRYDYVHVLLVRPSLGSWLATTGDGGPADSDGLLDGKIELDTDDLLDGGGSSGTIAQFEPGDLVFVFVPHQMGYVVTEVTK